MNLNQITVPSLNLTGSIPFYEQLGLKLIVKALPQYARFECPEGDATFSLHLVNKGLNFDELPNDKDWLWREARLQDPDGNQLILYSAGENRKNPPWRIN